MQTGLALEKILVNEGATPIDLGTERLPETGAVVSFCYLDEEGIVMETESYVLSFQDAAKLSKRIKMLNELAHIKEETAQLEITAIGRAVKLGGQF